MSAQAEKRGGQELLARFAEEIRRKAPVSTEGSNLKANTSK